jgi:uncharacterized membrane protein
MTQKENKLHKTKNDKHTNYYDNKHDIRKEVGVKHFSILPHPATLESYESISPGITEKLGTMIEKEQQFRHRLDSLHMRGIRSIYRLGQLISFILVIFILLTSIFIYVEYKDQYFASVICISGFTFLTIVNVNSFKKMTSLKNKKQNT